MTLSSFCDASNAPFAGISSWTPCQFSQWQQRRCEDLVKSGVWACPITLQWLLLPWGRKGDPPATLGIRIFRQASLSYLYQVGIQSWDCTVALHRNLVAGIQVLPQQPLRIFQYSICSSYGKQAKEDLTCHRARLSLKSLQAPVLLSAKRSMKQAMPNRGDEKSHWLDDLNNF